MATKARVPVPGYAWNPLLKFPRNQLCFCGRDGGLKFKNCCDGKIARIVKEEVVPELKKILDYHERLAKKRTA